jgi:hypothetical protein
MRARRHGVTAVCRWTERGLRARACPSREW